MSQQQVRRLNSTGNVDDLRMQMKLLSLRDSVEKATKGMLTDIIDIFAAEGPEKTDTERAHPPTPKSAQFRRRDLPTASPTRSIPRKSSRQSLPTKSSSQPGRRRVSAGDKLIVEEQKLPVLIYTDTDTNDGMSPLSSNSPLPSAPLPLRSQSALLPSPYLSPSFPRSPSGRLQKSPSDASPSDILDLRLRIHRAKREERAASETELSSSRLSSRTDFDVEDMVDAGQTIPSISHLRLRKEYLELRASLAIARTTHAHLRSQEHPE